MCVLPRPPHTNVFRVFVDIPDEQREEATLLMMGKDEICPAFWWGQADVPGWATTEVNVGDATWDGDVEEQLVDLGALFDSARTAVRVDIRSEATLRGTGGRHQPNPGPRGQSARLLWGDHCWGRLSARSSARWRPVSNVDSLSRSVVSEG